MRLASGALAGTQKFKSLPMPAGGYVTMIDAADDGTMIYGCDTHTPGIMEPGGDTWRQAIRGGVTLPANQINLLMPPGTYGAAVCATNSNVMACFALGYVMRSTDKGYNWTRTALAQNANHGGNLSSRMFHRHLVIDPNNANVIVAGFRDATKLQYSLDGGATWTMHPDIPAGNQSIRDGGMSIAYDRSSALIGGRTSVVYVFSSGSGIFKSTTGITGSFTLMSGSPTDIFHMVVHPTNGALFVSNGPLYRYNGSAFVPVVSQNTVSVTFNTTDPTKAWALGPGGGIFYSTDSGASFGAEWTGVRRAPETPWMEWTLENYMSAGDLCWDAAKGVIVFAMGIGTWEALPTANGFTWTARSKGIANMVGMNAHIIPSDGTILGACQDRPLWRWSRDDVVSFPGRHGPNNKKSIAHCNNIDHAIDDDNYLVAMVLNTPYHSFDRGRSWAPMVNVNATSMDPVGGQLLGTPYCGNMAVSNKGNAILMGSGARPQYTTDFGATWNYCDFGSTASNNAATTLKNNFFGAYYLTATKIFADKSTPGKFVMLSSGNFQNDANDIAIRGVWTTTNGGANMVQTRTTHIGPADHDYYNTHFKAVPGQSGHIFFTPGNVNDNSVNDTSAPLRMSQDGGATWTTVPGVFEARGLGFGRNLPGRSYPAIYVAAEASGLYRCLTFDPNNIAATTWEFLDQFPADGMFSPVSSLDADMSKFGRVVFSCGNTGFFVGDYGITLDQT